MKPSEITPENTVFVLLSFEGPDRYSRAGGLATRVTELSATLAESGFETHLIFVGSPTEPGEEKQNHGKLTLHRWCQWISKYYPDGVYQGEDSKLYDFNESVPRAVRDRIVAPNAKNGKVTVVLGEEWHTAEAMSRISDMLYYNNLRDKAILLWNANNTFSFHRINWGRLSYTTTITTVSRYMKHVLWGEGVDPIVIPNGIPERLLEEVDLRRARSLRATFPSDVVFFKLGRWDPDKRWVMAVEATAQLKATGVRPLLILRGGLEPHEGAVVYAARRAGLKVIDIRPNGERIEDLASALAAAREADVINVKAYLSEEVVRLLFAAADGVLANSGIEPFGLVGLEAMAAGAVTYTGSTGEDYAVPFENAVVVETADPGEIERYAIRLLQNPAEAANIRRAGRETAARFTWPKVVRNMVTRLDFLGLRSGVLAPPAIRKPPTKRSKATIARPPTLSDRRRRAPEPRSRAAAG